MGFLKRLTGNGEPAAPAWSPFDRGKDHAAFVDLVVADLGRRGLTFTHDDGMVTVATPDDADGHQFGLTNLSQQCFHHDRDDWPRVIAGHFDNLLAMQRRNLDALAEDYEQVRRILRVRLMPDESMGGVPDYAPEVARPLAPGIRAVVVYDFPDSTQSVPPEHVATWPVDPDTLFEHALANLGQEPRPIHEDADTGETSVRIWYGDSFYVATHALRLDGLLPEGTTDALIAVPNRHTLLVHPIVDGQAVPAMQAIYQMGKELYRDGPGSISDQPYWWHEGALTQIPHVEEGKRIAVYPPDGFVELLETTLGRSAGE
jgi:hypothetical protein